MTEPHVFQLDLKTLKEPDDLWNKLFLACIKNLAEQNAMNMQRLRAMEKAVEQLDRSVSEVLPEKPEELRAAMQAIEELQKAWKGQSTRSLDNVEKIAVTLKRLVASQ